MKNEVFIGVGIDNDKVFKKFSCRKGYDNEKIFYLTYNYNYDFIPDLLDFDDEKMVLTFQYVGENIKKEDMDLQEVQRLHDELILDGIYHNDYRAKNILYNKQLNKYYIIDFEFWDNDFTDFRTNVSNCQELRFDLNILPKII